MLSPSSLPGGSKNFTSDRPIARPPSPLRSPHRRGRDARRRAPNTPPNTEGRRRTAASSGRRIGRDPERRRDPRLPLAGGSHLRRVDGPTTRGKMCGSVLDHASGNPPALSALVRSRTRCPAARDWTRQAARRGATYDSTGMSSPPASACLARAHPKGGDPRGGGSADRARGRNSRRGGVCTHVARGARR